MDAVVDAPDDASQPRDTRDPARNPSRPFHGGWSAMPLMDSAPSRPECSGPAKVIATAIEVLARAGVSSRRHCGAPTVIPAQRRHSCASRNRSAPLWIPAFAGMTKLSAEMLCFWRRRSGGAVRSWLGGSAARGKRGSGPWMGGDPISVAREGLRNEDRASLDRRVAANPKARRLALTSQLAPHTPQHVVVASDRIACDSE